MMKAPLLDATVPENKLADWIHAHTMRVHQFLDDQVRRQMLHHALPLRVQPEYVRSLQ